MRIVIVYVLVIFSFLSCKTKTIEGFDSVEWKKDKNGCNNLRKKQIQLVLSNRESLNGMTEAAIQKIFGRPDLNELYKRGQKFYWYYLTPSTKCTSSNEIKIEHLSVRFNALGKVSEITVEKE